MTPTVPSHLTPVTIRPEVSHRPAAVPLAEALRRSADARGHPGYVQDALAVDLAVASDEQLFGPQSTARADLPDPAPWAG